METTPRKRSTVSTSALALTATGILLASPTAAYAGTTTYDFRCTPPADYQEYFPPFDAEVTVELTGSATAAPGASVDLEATVTLDPPQVAPDILDLVGGMDGKDITATLDVASSAGDATQVDSPGATADRINGGDVINLKPFTGAYTVGDAGTIDLTPGDMLIKIDAPVLGPFDTPCVTPEGGTTAGVAHGITVEAADQA
ncbi:hypothetical protein CDO52_14485 [Nocardiopsis gilva YIM 90087]|uniref:Cyclase n=1 Tax=Nocardiopsis gilva YIM 90087 TaxID=1235441 RepID=A0A223S6S4_9ACTN|nr:hypothetical protein [Nocardiopsis gilva]ASU83830.1 hypothetical protein CDO52_14485 [Nocardiopsis gilva YIM 90087]